MRTPAAILIAGVTVVMCGSAAHAQSAIGQRVSVEFVGAVNTSSAAVDDPFVFLDATATARITDDFDLVVRPYARRLPGGNWSKEMYQLQVRYQPDTRIPVRIDAGIIASPLGIMALEMRPDRNPVIGTPSYYFSPLPSFDGTSDRVQLLSGGYPLGAVASVSGARWDARAGITDGTPARNRKMMSSGRPPARAQFVTGAGVTPIPGLRLGAGFARGVYREPRLSAPQRPAASATVFNLEGEYAVGYTRLAGEWIVDSFDTMTNPAVSRGCLLEAVQTLTPRWYAAARVTRTSTPAFTNGTRVRRSSSSGEATLGFRLSPAIILKAGYQGSRAYSGTQWEHAAAVSLVLFERWW
jgi:hypothetical protein